MGVVNSIRHDEFPRQSTVVGDTVSVCFHYDTDHVFDGVIVRDDVAEPYLMIIKLEDGRHVLSTECQYT